MPGSRRTQEGMSNHQNPVVQSRIDAAREGNGRFGRWMSSVDESVTLPAPAPPMGLQELKDLHRRSATAARAAELNERLSGIAIAAQHVLYDYPQAESIVLDWDTDGEIEAVRVQDTDRTTLGSYYMGAGGGPDWTATHEWLSCLESANRAPAWKVYAPEAMNSTEDHARVCLAPAAAWSPEPAGDDLAA